MTTIQTAIPRLLSQYRDTILGEVMEAHGITNPHAAPRLRKIVVSMGVGMARENKTLLEEAAGHLSTLSGQKPSLQKARQSVANFKLREGMPIGCKVTLRGVRMWEFLDRLISVAIPRIKDFRGLSRKLDGGGNYSFGIEDQTAFPEIVLDRVKNMQGMDITIVTTTDSDEVALDLLSRLGVPFERLEEETDN